MEEGDKIALNLFSRTTSGYRKQNLAITLKF